MNRNREIAIAGITTALALVFSLLAVYVDFLTASFSVLSALVMMLPIAKGRYLGVGLSYVATSLLLMLFASPLLSLPFIVVFGGYTVFTTITADKKIKPYIAYPVKVIWINGALALFYLATDFFFIDFDKLGFTLNYFPLALIVTVIGLLYDFCLIVVYKKIKELAGKHIKQL